jgi:hypothetical protein
MFNHPADAAMNRFTRGLAGLAPDTGSLDRDRLLFRAGAVLPTRRLRLWRAIAGVLAVAALSLAATLMLRPPAQRERVVYVSVPEFLPAPPTETTPVEPLVLAPERAEPESSLGPLVQADLDGLRLRQQVLQFGVEALPPPPTWSGPAPDPMPLEQLLGLPAEGLDRVSTRFLLPRANRGERP